MQLWRCCSRVYLRDVVAWYDRQQSRYIVSDASCVAASGLLWISELIEEHSRVAKVWGQRGIYVSNNLDVLNFYADFGDASDHHSCPHLAIFLRFPPWAPHPVLDRVPHRVPAKLHA